MKTLKKYLENKNFTNNWDKLLNKLKDKELEENLNLFINYLYKNNYPTPSAIFSDQDIITTVEWINENEIIEVEFSDQIELTHWIDNKIEKIIDVTNEFEKIIKCHYCE